MVPSRDLRAEIRAVRDFLGLRVNASQFAPRRRMDSCAKYVLRCQLSVRVLVELGVILLEEHVPIISEADARVLRIFDLVMCVCLRWLMFSCHVCIS